MLYKWQFGFVTLLRLELKYMCHFVNRPDSILVVIEQLAIAAFDNSAQFHHIRALGTTRH